LKIKERTKKKKSRGKIIGLIIIAGIVSAAVYSYYQQEASKGGQWKWVTSGPFSINKSQYLLGENVFMVVSGLKPTDVGEIDVVTPKGDTYSQIPFNGTLKSSFKQFFKPNTEARHNLCNATDLVGNWDIIFKGSQYKSIRFEIKNEYLPGESNKENGLDTVPKGAGPC
jgi:hypothetical protein